MEFLRRFIAVIAICFMVRAIAQIILLKLAATEQIMNYVIFVAIYALVRQIVRAEKHMDINHITRWEIFFFIGAGILICLEFLF